MKTLVNLKLIKWLCSTYIDKSYKNYNDCHLDELIKHLNLANFDLEFWSYELMVLGRFCNSYNIPISIVLNIPISKRIEDYTDIVKNIDSLSMPSFYLIDKPKLLEIKSSDINIIKNDSINNLISYVSKYKSIWREDEQIITCQIAYFNKFHKKIFTSI